MTTVTNSIITVNKNDLDRAINACDVNGSYYLCEDGDIVWGEKNGGSNLPDNVICKIPVADPDGSGNLHDACWDQLKESYQDKWFESDCEGDLRSYIEDVILDGGSAVAFLEENQPDHFEEIEKFLKEDALNQLNANIESVEIWLDEYTQETRHYSLEVREG